MGLKQKKIHVLKIMKIAFSFSQRIALFVFLNSEDKYDSEEKTWKVGSSKGYN